MRTNRIVAITLGLLLSTSPLFAAKVDDARMQADLAKSLSNKRYAGVQAAVHNGVVILSGNVDVFSEKEEADRKAHHVKGVAGVQNNIAVTGGGNVSDVELRDKLAEKLAVVRVGYGTNAFNSFTIGVQNGVVTLGGTAVEPVDKAAVIATVEDYPGVRDVIDNIEVAPLSPMDDRIRLQVARSVYGFPSLNKYAIDPAKPIRIVVIGGHVTLTGVVNNQGDKEAAGIRANSVGDVFSVDNQLQIANQTEEPAAQ